MLMFKLGYKYLFLLSTSRTLNNLERLILCEMYTVFQNLSFDGVDRDFYFVLIIERPFELQSYERVLPCFL